MVHVFVIGEWVVKPEDEKDMEQHESTTKEDFWDKMGVWWADPFNKLFTGFMGIFILVAIVIIALAATGYLGPIILAFYRKR